MHIALLIISSASLICSAGCLCIMAKTAKELKDTKTYVDSEVAKVTAKVDHNKKVVRTAISQLEF